MHRKLYFFLVEVGIVYQSHFGENETKEKYNRNIVDDSANFHLICKNPNDRNKKTSSGYFTYCLILGALLLLTSQVL